MPQAASSDVTEARLPNPAVALTGGWGTYCALLSDHTTWCWGRNFRGAVGDGTIENRFTPVRVNF
jgi:hypothetical protein